MECSAINTLAITACLAPTIDTGCNIGDFCTVEDSLYNSDCSFTGSADQYLTKLISNAFDCFSLSKVCISDGAVTGYTKCDFIMGVDYNNGNWSDDWKTAGIYTTETVSALYAADISYGPWDFLTPFKTNLWVFFLCVMFVLTPLVMSIVEYDEDETVWGNFCKFLPDSIHAHAGIDLVNNDLPTKNTSYLLSVFISLFSFIILTLYASNLTAFVLYKNSGTTMPTEGLSRYGSEGTYVDDVMKRIVNITGAIDIPYYTIPTIHASGSFDVIISEDYFLNNIKTCDETVRPFRGIGKYKYLIVSSKFGEENIAKIRRTMRTINYVPRAFVDRCKTLSSVPIGLGGIYGVFIIFFVPATVITVAVIIRWILFGRTKNPYITQSP